MSADILTFPGDRLPDRPITEQEVDRLHSKNFRDLEGRINDCASMAAIRLARRDRSRQRVSPPDNHPGASRHTFGARTHFPRRRWRAHAFAPIDRHMKPKPSDCSA